MTNKILQQLAHSASIQFQGSFVAVAIRRPTEFQKVHSHRGIVQDFSRMSRLRLLKLINKTNIAAHKWTFITLTYRSHFPHPAIAKKHLRAWLKRLYRSKYGILRKLAVLWRMELQKRGAPHFHLLIPDCPYLPFKEIKQWWNAVIGTSGARVHITLLNDRKGAMYYVAKYIAKIKTPEEAPLDFSLFILPPYQAETSFGRWWGIENRSEFPFAETVWLEVADMFEAVYTFKRYARRYYRGVSGNGNKGFTLFVQNAARWEELWNFVLRECRKGGGLPHLVSRTVIKAFRNQLVANPQK